MIIIVAQSLHNELLPCPFNYVFLFKENNVSQIYKSYERYKSMFSDFDNFKQIFDDVTNNYGTLVINEEKCFWYKANM